MPTHKGSNSGHASAPDSTSGNSNNVRHVAPRAGADGNGRHSKGNGNNRPAGTPPRNNADGGNSGNSKDTCGNSGGIHNSGNGSTRD